MLKPWPIKIDWLIAWLLSLFPKWMGYPVQVHFNFELKKVNCPILFLFCDISHCLSVRACHKRYYDSIASSACAFPSCSSSSISPVSCQQRSVNRISLRWRVGWTRGGQEQSKTARKTVKNGWNMSARGWIHATWIQSRYMGHTDLFQLFT